MATCSPSAPRAHCVERAVRSSVVGGNDDDDDDDERLSVRAVPVRNAETVFVGGKSVVFFLQRRLYDLL